MVKVKFGKTSKMIVESEFISKLQRYKDQNNAGIAVNMLFNNKKHIYAAQIPKPNGRCSKQVHLLMIPEGENRHHTTIKTCRRWLSF